MRHSRCRMALVFCAMAVLPVLEACTGASPDTSATSPQGPLVATDVWVRAADSGATTAAYMALHNVDTGSVTIISVITPVSADASVHETMDHDGMVHMMARTELIIAPDSTLRMAPAGVHLMLTNLRRRLTVGDAVSLQFALRNRPPVSIIAPVVSSTDR